LCGFKEPGELDLLRCTWLSRFFAIRDELRHALPILRVDNKVGQNVISAVCQNCGRAIFSSEIDQSSEPPKAIADRTGNALRVICPHCQFRNEFPNFAMVYIFLCHDCGEPVIVEQFTQ